MGPLTVCLVVNLYPPFSLGGVENYVRWLARSLSRQGCRVIVFHPTVLADKDDYARESRDDGDIRVWMVNRKPDSPHPMFGDSRLERVFTEVLTEERVEVVHFQHLCGHLAPSLVETAKQLGLPTVLTLHDSWLFCGRGHAIDYLGKPCSGPESLDKCGRCQANGDEGRQYQHAVMTQLRNSYLRRVFDTADLVTVTSQYLRSVGEQAPWLPKEHLLVAPLGLAGFETRPPVPRRPAGPIRLGAFGNFLPFGPDEIDLKGALTLLEAFRQLPEGAFELHFHGRVEGPWKEELAATPGITVHGPFPFDPDPRGELLANLDLVVVPSLIEVCPTVPREAFVAGVPVLASRAGGLPEVVLDGENGLLFEPGDACGLATLLMRFLEEPDLLPTLRSGVRAPLEIARDAAEWMGRYHQLVGDKTPPTTDEIISVVVSTYNRRNYLETALEAFCEQTLPRENYEIIVVDDHSDEPVDDLIRQVEDRVAIRYIRQDRRRGPNAARNAGWRAAKGSIILFFDDDDRPTPRMLAEHLRTHLEHTEPEAAVLGYTGWDPSLEITPVMYHVTRVGKQYFSYPDIPAGQPLPWHYFWTGRSSIKRELLEASGGFDEGFPLPTLDDLELAHRLRDSGITMYYNPRAVSFGLRPLDLGDFCRRSKSHGTGLSVFLRKHEDPDLLDHFNVRDAEDRWLDLELKMERLGSEIAKLAAHPLSELRTSPIRDGSGRVFSAEDLLHRYLCTYFEGFRLSGLVEARARAAEESEEAVPGAPQRLLFLAPELPLFDRSSGGFRLFQILKLAREAGHSVTYIAREPGDVADASRYVDALEALGVEVYPYDPDKILETWDAKVSQPRIDFPAMLEERHFDVAYCYFYEIADLYRDEIRTFSPATKIVVDSVDLHFLREYRRGTFLGDDKVIERALKIRKKELESYAAADVVVTVTDVDRDAALAIDPTLRIEVIPNLHPIPETAGGFRTRRDLVFVGGFNHLPNVEAMQVFCAEVWPAVADRLPDAKLFVVGANPPGAIKGLAGDRVVVTGYVEDTLPYLRQCRISVAPLLYGAGMKGKVGEALAAGLPVVGTTIACEGMGLADGEHVLVADSPAAMIEAIVRLYTDEALWTRLAETGRSHIAGHYSPAAAAAVLGRVLLGGGQGRPPHSESGERRPAHAESGEGRPAHAESGERRPPHAESGERRPAHAEAPGASSYKASIVIPVWNRVDYTTRCLEALAESIPEDYSYEVVVVDNGSTDGTPDLLATLGGDVQVLTNKTNLGFARACNQGARAAKGEWIVFLNNDTEPRAGWLEEMLALAEREDRVGVVGAKLLYPDGTIQHAGVAFTGKAEGKFIVHGEHFDKDVFIDLLPYHLYRKMPADAPYVNKVRDFQVVTGACLAIRRDLFEDVGGFDEAFHNGFEDVDLCLKALQRDQRVVYCPTAVVLHHESKSEGRHDHDLPNARLFHDRWSSFAVPDDERFYREDGFAAESPQEHMTIWRFQESFGRAEELFAAGRYEAALAEYEAFLAVAPDHGGARIKVAVARERLASAV
ncbi:MAG: glycosyltransferase [Candidatus Sericytochromatia bacterium]|nr:glycosyltransferase [Candidatus Tanganyikabacteria bacterium]